MYSIVIPVYNGALYLRECLDSLVTQTWKQWEAICVDDGSTDESGELLCLYARQDHRIKVLRQENEGVGCARNRALDVASSDWIMFLDGDDVFHPEALSTLAKCIKEDPNLDGIFFSLKEFSGDLAWSDIGKGGSRVIDATHSVENLPAYGFSCCVYRRATLDKIRFKRYSVGEDLLFLAEYLQKGRRFVVVNDALYGYRRHPGSVVSSPNSFRKLSDCILYCSDLIRLYNASSKRASLKLVNAYCNRLVEEVPSSIGRLPSVERNILWDCWQQILRTLSHCHILSRVQRFRISLVCERMYLVWILCIFPFCLKRCLRAVIGM